MGVPAFFKWLSDKYNKIVSHCVEEKGKVGENGERDSVDIGKENPNGVEFDNLYLDMNGIIHPCTHPEHKAAPGTEEEMMVEIFAYIDRVMSVVRPRRVLYLAVDGVAPRAKMNQQRSRRFRAGKEARERTVTLATLRQELLLKGAILPEPKPASQHFDSNCITPGTPFMSRLSLALQYFIYMKLNSDSGWANIQVILSDASAPGEGEHKIMDYIRRQRASPTHDPNTKHCLCGADADLIMLGLATHEPYFTIIREEFKPNQPKPCELCGQLNHSLNECQGLESLEFNVGVNNVGAECEFIFIHINILREYLQVDLFMNDLPFKYDFERAIDDWVFMCFFVGNDFLPHLPSLEIREKAIDTLIALYKTAVYKTKGWLTDSGIVNLERVQMIMKDLALAEDEIFQNRRNREMDFRKKGKSRRMSSKRQRIDQSQYFNVNKNIELVRPNMGEKFSKSSAIEAAHAAMTEPTLNQFGKRKFDVVEEDDEDIRNKELDKRDEVKLWEEGYRTRYYQSKFGVSVTENPEFCVNVAHQYVRGLCWVLAYYYQGCPSWTWYYPYHYAPFAIDFLNVVDTDVSFTANSKPFNPLEQLMGVFPADSKDHIPPAWHSLMTDSESPVIDFYPIDFKIDLNGKRFDWQGVALLPFVDETRLLPALEMFYDKLTDEEIERNVRGPDRYFVKSSHPMATLMKVVHEDSSDTVLDPELSNGVTGRIWKDEKSYLPGDVVKSAVKDLCDDICDIKVISCFYQDPQYTESFIFPATLLKNLTMPPVTLGPDAIRIERQNRRSFDTRPMNRMVRHSLGEGNNSSSDQSRQYGFSPFFDKKPLSLGFNSVETNSNKSYHEGLYQKGNNIGQYQQRDNSSQRSNNQGNNNAMYQQREYSQGNYQQRGNNQGQYQQRGNNQGQYQQSGNNYGQYQQSTNNQGQYQQRGNNQGQYQQRGNNQGLFQQRGNNQVQYQQRGNSQGQYRQENNNNRGRR